MRVLVSVCYVQAVVEKIQHFRMSESAHAVYDCVHLCNTTFSIRLRLYYKVKLIHPMRLFVDPAEYVSSISRRVTKILGLISCYKLDYIKLQGHRCSTWVFSSPPSFHVTLVTQNSMSD